MKPIDIKKIEGYSNIEDLIPERNFLKYTQLWSMDYTHFMDESGDIKRRLIIELCKDLNEYEKPTIKIILDEPQYMNLCPNNEICGLVIAEMITPGHKASPFLQLYDDEISDWKITFKKIRFDRGEQKPKLEQKNHD
jgi:hypothetical protein